MTPIKGMQRRLISETPEIHKRLQGYIQREVARPCKQWIHEVIAEKREKERVKLRTPEFVLLPDVKTTTKKWDEKKFHWLALATDTEIRTLRDLRGKHLPILKNIQKQASEKIKEETGLDPEQVMAYIHYPPSVYQLHIHFKHPIGTHDTLRMHSLANVINNLELDPDYYLKSTLQMPVYVNSDMYSEILINTLSCFSFPYAFSENKRLSFSSCLANVNVFSARSM
jgi:m7GpppX diphosphatase